MNKSCQAINLHPMSRLRQFHTPRFSRAFSCKARPPGSSEALNSRTPSPCVGTGTFAILASHRAKQIRSCATPVTSFDGRPCPANAHRCTTPPSLGNTREAHCRSKPLLLSNMCMFPSPYTHVSEHKPLSDFTPRARRHTSRTGDGTTRVLSAFLTVRLAVLSAPPEPHNHNILQRS